MLHFIFYKSFIIFITSFIVSLVSISRYIKSTKINNHQPIRSDGPKAHLKTKAKTPTLGGLFIIFSTVVSIIIWVPFYKNIFLITSLFFMIILAILGFLDDKQKIKYKNSKGLSAKLRLIITFISSLIMLYLIMPYFPDDLFTSINLHIYNYTYILHINIYIMFLFYIFILLGAINSSNFTDGLDGLLSYIYITILISFIVILSMMMTFFNINNNIYYYRSIFELMFLLFALLGSVLGFLWFNGYKAQLFMGDTGSLPLGGIIGFIAIIIKQEIFFAVISSIIIAETVSVILQVLYYKKTKGKRLFLMAPLHHHFEKKGLSESKVVVRFFIISILINIFAIIFIGIY